MFGHLPSRTKNDCHSPSDYYDMARKGRPLLVRACSSDYFNSACRTEDPWERLYRGSPPFGLDSFRNNPDMPYSQRLAPHDLHYASDPRRSYDDRGISFEKTAADLYAALEHAGKELQNLHKTFHAQTSGLTAWLPAQYVDLLWTIYTEWDGLPADSLPPKTPKLNPNTSSSFNTPTTFNTLAKRIAKASDAIKQSAPPTEKLGFFGSTHPLSSSLPDNNAKTADWSWENIRTTMCKLQISLDAIEEMVSVVRQQRQRMGSLVREIVAARQLLEGIRDVWEVLPRRKGKSPQEDGIGLGRSSSGGCSTSSGRNEWMDI